MLARRATFGTIRGVNDSDFQDLTPKLGELRILKANSKKLREQGSAKSKKIVVKGLVDPVPCVICGVIFDRYNHGNEKFENCRGCRDKLESGLVAFVCLVTEGGIYDGRYSFMARNEMPGGVKLTGKVLGVMPHTMDLIEAKKDGRIMLLSCTKCKFQEFIIRQDSDPAEAVAAQAPCPDCRALKNTPEAVTYFDGSGAVISKNDTKS